MQKKFSDTNNAVAPEQCLSLEDLSDLTGKQKYCGEDVPVGTRTIERISKEIMPVLCKFLYPWGNGNVLDVGCGNGRFNRILSLFYEFVIGIDPLDKVLDKYIYANCKYIETEIGIFSPSIKFDTIFFWGSFYVMDHFSVLNRCERMLNSGGNIIIIESMSQIMYKMEDVLKKTMLKVVEKVIFDKSNFVLWVFQYD